jgi:AraC family transcriptional regulator
LVALRTAAQKVLPDAGRERVSLPRYKLRRVLELVDRRIDERLTVHEMAQVAEMSVYHFSRKFKECTGLAPHQYVRHCRMKIAADMLANSDESIAIIARRVGCSDQSHFTGVFKRVFCTTPADFRRKRREIEAGSS